MTVEFAAKGRSIAKNTAMEYHREASLVEFVVPTSADRPGLLKALLQAREGLLRQLRPALKDIGLTDQQWRVMSELARIDEISASDLASAACLRASSLSRIIKDLENRQLLVRRSHRDDLRRTMISATRQGRALVERVMPLAQSIARDLSDRFGADRTAAVHDLSDALAVTLGGNVGDDDGE